MLAWPHLALHLAEGAAGCRCRPSKNRPTSKGKGFTQRGFQKKGPPLLERERSGASSNGGEVGEPAPPREPLGFSQAALSRPLCSGPTAKQSMPNEFCPLKVGPCRARRLVAGGALPAWRWRAGRGRCRAFRLSWFLRFPRLDFLLLSQPALRGPF